jgi:hypothetical protein
MRDYLELSSVPIDEPCAMVGSADYHRRARLECRVFINQLERAFPEAIAAGLYFRIKANGHDFGTYYEVEAVFDNEDENQTEWAYTIEDELPIAWDEDARNELAAAGIETVPRDDFWMLSPLKEFFR